MARAKFSVEALYKKRCQSRFVRHSPGTLLHVQTRDIAGRPRNISVPMYSWSLAGIEHFRTPGRCIPFADRQLADCADAAAH